MKGELAVHENHVALGGVTQGRSHRRYRGRKERTEIHGGDWKTQVMVVLNHYSQCCSTFMKL